ncbi:hypothetical protein [Alloalcanivorax marinus]|uniref:hypothetical protein n=1 Tax=Alloalcanivorax marinus TaxID=1177169 RepID=UPI0019346431|nr:hypothetical protein [Alloalcanivorax marinus]MBL7249264.1 hypothetical protein [Alloalcanivorax marinus]
MRPANLSIPLFSCPSPLQRRARSAGTAKWLHDHVDVPGFSAAMGGGESGALERQIRMGSTYFYVQVVRWLLGHFSQPFVIAVVFLFFLNRVSRFIYQYTDYNQR